MSDAATLIREWRADPARMAWDLFEFTPDRWQVRALRCFPSQEKQRLVLQACVGPGKTAVEAIMGLNFLLCYGDMGAHPVGAAVSVTAENLKNNLWKEFAVWRARSPLLTRTFDMTSERLFAREFPQTWFLAARSWSKTADPDAQGRTLSGLHGRFILYLIDESGDMAPAVGRAAEQGLAGCEWGKIVQAGNPTSQSGMLYEAVTKQQHLCDIVRVTGDPDDPDRSPRIPLEWASEQIRLYGRDNPWVMSAILGLFPPTSLNALLGPDEVAAAMGRHLREDQYAAVQKRIGVDVARFGDDSTVLFPRQGRAAFMPVEMRNARTHEIAARVLQAKSKWGSELELIDDTGGYAAGVIDQCLLGGVALMGVNFSGKADDPRYFNKRSEMHFRAAEWVKSGGALPPHDAVAREAVAPTYWFENGKFRVTEKEQIKKALQGHSPDFWDALCLTFAVAELPASGALAADLLGVGLGASTGHAAIDWDPYR